MAVLELCFCTFLIRKRVDRHPRGRGFTVSEPWRVIEVSQKSGDATSDRRVIRRRKDERRFLAPYSFTFVIHARWCMRQWRVAHTWVFGDISDGMLMHRWRETCRVKDCLRARQDIPWWIEINYDKLATRLVWSNPRMSCMHLQHLTGELVIGRDIDTSEQTKNKKSNIDRWTRYEKKRSRKHRKHVRGHQHLTKLLLG